MEILVVSDLVNVRPCRKIDVGVPAESELLTIDYDFDVSLKDYDDKMVFGPSRRVIDDMVRALDFTGEDIVVDIAHAGDVLGSENHRRLTLSVSAFFHLFILFVQIYII